MQPRTRARIAAELQRTLAEILEHDVKDPTIREAFPTVAEVVLSPDGSHAKVYVYVPDDIADRDSVIAAFEKDRGFLRSAVAARLKLRRVPELAFQLDLTLDRALRLEQMFDAEFPPEEEEEFDPGEPPPHDG